MFFCRSAIALFLVGGLLNIALAAAKERFVVEQGGVWFIGIVLDDGRSNPFKIIFDVDGDKATFVFDTEFNVAKIIVGNLNHDIGASRALIATPSNNESSGSTRRVLQEGTEITENQAFEFSVVERRRLITCGDCENAWNLMCDQGRPSVCALEDVDPPFEEQVETAIAILCDALVERFSAFTAEAACEGLCDEEVDNGK